MKALLITFDFPPIIGGISTVFYNVWKFLPKENFPVLAPLTAVSSDFDASFPGKVIRRRLPVKDSILGKTAKTALLMFYLPSIIRRENIDYIICGQPIIAGMAGLFIKKMCGIPFQVWVYGGEVVKFRDTKPVFSILLKVLKEADSVVVNSDFTKKVYLELGVDESKIIKLTPAVDTDIFSPGLDTGKFADKYGLRGKKVLMTVARLSERKGHDMVIRAVKALKDKFPDIVYLIVGTGPDEKRLRGLARELGIEDKVVFCGGVADSDLPLYYNLCDMHVMPNRQVSGPDTIEGFGLSFIEAGACAKPVIGGLSGGSYEAVQDNITGFLVDPLDEHALAGKISVLLGDNALAQKMGRAGLQRVLESFQWKDRAKIIEGFMLKRGE